MAEDWYKVGNLPEGPIRITQAQIFFLARQAEAVREILTPTERVAMEMMGYEDWVKELEKIEASRLIGRIKGDQVASKVTARTKGGPATPEKPQKDWYDTLFSGSGEE